MTVPMCGKHKKNRDKPGFSYNHDTRCEDRAPLLWETSLLIVAIGLITSSIPTCRNSGLEVYPDKVGARDN